METIDNLRKKNKYTYLQISQMLNCSKTYTWQLLTGKRKLSYEQAILIASIFNMKPDEIFYANFMNEQLLEKINHVHKVKEELSKNMIK